LPKPGVSLPSRYEKVMDAYDPDDIEFETILDLIDFKKDDKVLEVGTGVGRVAFKIAPYVKEVCGIDIDKEKLKIAKAKLQETCLNNVLMVCGDIEKIPFENDFFDVVLCPWVLHHVESKDAALREIHRTLKMGGVFLSIDVAADTDYIFLKGCINPEIPSFVTGRAKKVLDAIKESRLEIVAARRLHTYYLLPTIQEIYMFFKEFDISYQRLDKNFLHQFLEKRRTKNGYKISESAYITLAKKLSE